jgi:flagellar protein FlbD
VICLTRFNGSQFFLNIEHIQTVEETPDTQILLTNGQRYIVLETAITVAELIFAYQNRVAHGDT